MRAVIKEEAEELYEIHVSVGHKGQHPIEIVPPVKIVVIEVNDDLATSII